MNLIKILKQAKVDGTDKRLILLTCLSIIILTSSVLFIVTISFWKKDDYFLADNVPQNNEKNFQVDEGKEYKQGDNEDSEGKENETSASGENSSKTSSDDVDPVDDPQKEDGEIPDKYSFDKNIVLSYYFYDSVKSKLKSGDKIYATAIRNSPEVPITAEKFATAISQLNSVNGIDKGIVKSLSLSSVADLETYISQIPSSVTWISYNMEGSMTPLSERNNVVESLNEFSTIVHSSGRKASWGPIQSLFDTLEARGLLDDVISTIDGVGFQGQNILTNSGMDIFVATVSMKYQLFKGYNPSVKVYVQLVIDNNSETDIIEGFKNIENYLEYAVIFGPNTSDAKTNLNNIFDGLRT
ncbi:MAG: hypothetical protein ABIE03_00070 [Patescibacteria group bacterium]|nr:hypothetical protein [Patescibacteria group bacterium]